MATELILNGKQAVKVNAKKVIWGTSERAYLYDIEGVQKWVPKSLSKFIIDPKDKADIERGSHAGNISGTLLIEEWFFKKKLFPKS